MHESARRRPVCCRRLSLAVAGAATLTAAWGCRGQATRSESAAPAFINIGVAQLSPTDSPIRGFRQLSQIYSVESFLRPNEEGRLQPLLAESSKVSADGRSLQVRLRRGVKFHDGSPVDPAAVMTILPAALKEFMGPVYSDVERVSTLDANTVEVRFATSSPFVLEAMEAPFRKPGAAIVGTGPYVPVPNSTTEMRAFQEYYLGAPTIDRLVVTNYPSVRAAWADMLRDRIDMLYEVGTDALDSMVGSNNISLFTFTRHYQYTLAFNPKSKALRSREVRRALSWAIDRAGIVQTALKDHGVASSGPMAPGYWALDRSAPTFGYDVERATAQLAGDAGAAGGRRTSLRFTCLVAPDVVTERVALEMRRQLQQVGVDMTVEELPQEEFMQRSSKGEYDALLIEVISGPTLFRPYLVWRSESPLNFGHFGSATVDAALDGVRRAPSEPAYRTAVLDLQKAFMDDPPGIFVAWTVRARAVSKRFDVPAEEGRDVLSTIRMWKPAPAADRASRN
jgi:peptide/nickel transport system substrate-binding protein